MQATRHRPAVALAALMLLTALNLRAAVASVPPLLEEITRSVSLSAAAAGLLTTLPPLCMAAGAPLAPIVARRAGYETGIVLVMVTVAAGVAVRLPGGTATLFAGTVIAGLGIALGNVLVPALIKRDFPDHVGLGTGLYTMAVAASGAVAAAVTVPIEELLGSGWRVALAVWAIPALVVALLWLPRTGAGLRTARSAAVPPRAPVTLLRNPIAIQVTVFMGLQSMSFFGLLSWLPEVMRDAGASRASAGTLLSLMLVTGIPTCLLVPLWAGRRSDQRVAVAATVLLLAAALLGLLVARDVAPALWVSALGVAQGSMLGLTFLFFMVRTRSVHDAGRLAAMTQTFGFVIAATGPLALGALHELSGGWTVPLTFLLVALVPTLVAGLLAARDRLVPAAEDPTFVPETQRGR